MAGGPPSELAVLTAASLTAGQGFFKQLFLIFFWVVCEPHSFSNAAPPPWSVSPVAEEHLGEPSLAERALLGEWLGVHGFAKVCFVARGAFGAAQGRHHEKSEPA